MRRGLPFELDGHAVRDIRLRAPAKLSAGNRGRALEAWAPNPLPTPTKWADWEVRANANTTACALPPHTMGAASGWVSKACHAPPPASTDLHRGDPHTRLTRHGGG